MVSASYVMSVLEAPFEKKYVSNKTKKRKSHDFLDFEEKHLKNVKVMTCKVLETTQTVFVL